MGGGGEKKKTNAMLDQQNAQAQAEHNQYMGVVNKGLTGATDRASDMYNTLYGGYKGFAEGSSNFDPSKYGVSGGGGGGGGPAVDPRFGDVESSYRNFMSTGGVDTGMFNRFQGNLADVASTGGYSPEALASMKENIQGFKDIGRTGGVSAEDQARIRGGGVFDEFARTGGYSDADIANIRRRATSVIPSYYQAAKDEAGRMAAIQGGYGPGQAALFSRMGRDQSKNAAQSALEAETAIKDKVLAGRQWGAGQMSSSEQGLQQLLSSNRLAGLTGASNTEAGMLRDIAQARIGAASAGGGNEIGMQGLVQKGKLAGTQGLEGMAESAAARAAASSAQAAADAKWQAQFNREGQQYGLDSMKSLYGMAPGEVEMYLGASNTGQQTANQVGGRIIDQRIQANPQRDWLGTIMGGVGAAGGLMTGLGALGSNAPRPTTQASPWLYGPYR